MKKISQYGRTMLETISVLALIGILGITGIYMYMRGVNSAKSDALIKEVLVRASQKKANADLSGMGSKKKVFTPEYAKNKSDGTKEYETSGLYGYEFSVESYKNVPNFVTVSVSGISSAICRDLKSKVLVYNSDGSAHIDCVLKTEPTSAQLKNCSSNAKNIAQSDCSSEDGQLHFVVEFGKKTTSQSGSSGGGSGSGTNPTPGQTLPEEETVSCPPNSSKLGTGYATNVDGCKCNGGLKWIGNACCPNGTSGEGLGGTLPDFPQCKCPIHLQEYNSMGKCECPPNYDECGGECMSQCSGPGLSGERDQKTCACKCIPGTDSTTCQCPAGEIYTDGACHRAYCKPEFGLYTCYMDNTICGYLCKDTTFARDSCYGYCGDYCPAGTKLGRTRIGYTGLGCVDETRGLYCATYSSSYNSKQWVCKREDKSSAGICCIATGDELGQCDYGTCDPSVCLEFNGDDSSSTYGQIADRTYGCIVTRNGKTAYCSPRKNGKWYCQYQKTNSEYMSLCADGGTKEQLKNGSAPFNKCFEDPDCTAGGWANSEWKENPDGLPEGGYCLGKGSDGYDYACNLTGECYGKNADNEWQGCGRGCTTTDRKGVNPNICYLRSGVCDRNFCQNGTTLKPLNAKIWGCTIERGDGIFGYWAGSWGKYKCQYKKEGASSFSDCGFQCSDTHDCTQCKQAQKSECAPSGKCTLHYPITDDCDCSKADGEESNGYCCPKNHVYHAGKCSIITVPEDKCYYGSHLIEETNDYKTQGNGVECQCVAAGHCMGKNEYGIISCRPEFCKKE